MLFVWESEGTETLATKKQRGFGRLRSYSNLMPLREHEELGVKEHIKAVLFVAMSQGKAASGQETAIAKLGAKPGKLWWTSDEVSFLSWWSGARCWNTPWKTTKGSKTNVQSCSTLLLRNAHEFSTVELVYAKRMYIEGSSDYPAVNWAKLVLTCLACKAHNGWLDQKLEDKKLFQLLCPCPFAIQFLSYCHSQKDVSNKKTWIFSANYHWGEKIGHPHTPFSLYATGRLEAVQPQVVTRPVPSRRLIESDGSIGRGVEFLLNGGWRLARPCNQHNLHNTPCLPEISAFYLHFDMGFRSMSGVIKVIFWLASISISLQPRAVPSNVCLN